MAKKITLRLNQTNKQFISYSQFHTFVIVDSIYANKVEINDITECSTLAFYLVTLLKLYPTANLCLNFITNGTTVESLKFGRGVVLLN
jgi:hypothetical protein